MPTGNPTSKGGKCIFNRGILHPQITAESSTMIRSSRTYFFFKDIKSSNRKLEGLRLLKLFGTEDCEYLLLTLYQAHSHES